jgi:hypothetical protein
MFPTEVSSVYNKRAGPICGLDVLVTAFRLGPRNLLSKRELPHELTGPQVELSVHLHLNSFIKDVIEEKSINHHDKLGNHSNPIFKPLLEQQQRRRLKKV